MKDNTFVCIPELEHIALPDTIRRFAPDDMATADDMAAVYRAREEYKRRETVSHEDINWD